MIVDEDWHLHFWQTTDTTPHRLEDAGGRLPQFTAHKSNFPFSDHELMLFKVAALQGHGHCVGRQPISFAYEKQHDDSAMVFTSYKFITERKACLAGRQTAR